MKIKRTHKGSLAANRNTFTYRHMHIYKGNRDRFLVIFSFAQFPFFFCFSYYLEQCVCTGSSRISNAVLLIFNVCANCFFSYIFRTVELLSREHLTFDFSLRIKRIRNVIPFEREYQNLFN